MNANDRIADGTRRSFDTETAAREAGVEKVVLAPDGRYYEQLTASPAAIAYVTAAMRNGPAEIQDEYNRAQLDRLKYDPKPWFSEGQNTGIDVLTNATLTGVNGTAPTVQPIGGLVRRVGSEGANVEVSTARPASAVNQPLGRGSTGRTMPATLQEHLAMQQAMSNPASGQILPVPMTDSRWPAAEGWVKMSQNINSIEIHYVRNIKSGAVDDFKFK